jgi:hypothetical protein
MTPQKLRERRRARIEKQRRTLSSAALNEAMASMFRAPTAKEQLRCLAIDIAISAAIVSSILYFTL